MKLGLLIVAAALTTVAGSALAADVDLSKLPPASDKKGLTYEKDIQPLFKASCYNCHGPTGRASGGLRLDTLEAALKGTTDGKIITPGDGKKSTLLVSVARLDPQTAMPRAPRRGRGPRGGPGGTNAPAGGAPEGAGAPGGGMGGQGRGPGGPPPKNLTPEEVGLVRAWIDQGAK